MTYQTAEKFVLDVKADIFEQLKSLDNNAIWWTNLKSDNDIYIDIRKGNELNVYYNGGNILKITNKKCEIHYKYIPLETDNDYDYVPVVIDGKNAEIDTSKIKFGINNFDKKTLSNIKRNISLHYPNASEKAIQGYYATNKKDKNGIILDTEFAFNDKDNLRIDMAYLDCSDKSKPILYFVELKTINDKRLYPQPTNVSEKLVQIENGNTIDVQLKRYHDFIIANKTDLLEYYKKVFDIKKDLGLFSRNQAMTVTENVVIENLRIEEKPILLIGDATNEFIKQYESSENAFLERIKRHSFARIYRGSGSNFINLTNSKNVYK